MPIVRCAFLLSGLITVLSLCSAASLVLSSTELSSTNLPLMPLPRSSRTSAAAGTLVIDNNFSIVLSGPGASDDRVRAAAPRTLKRLIRQTGIPLHSLNAEPAKVKASDATLLITVDNRDHRPPQKLGDDESYSLSVANGRARLSAKLPLGALRGLETFLQLVQQNKTASGQSNPGFSVQPIEIQDGPRFAWRGLSLDVSRHFLPIEDVERTLDGMALVKLNVLHWHLSDDQGFRVESKKFPKLQQVASEGKFYSQSEVRAVIAYARNLGIRVIPEFDMPGHAAALLAAYPMLAAGPGPQSVAHNYGILTRLIDPTKDSTYRFLDTLIAEMAKLFPDEYFHIGGDEVDPAEWTHNPDIQAFMRTPGMQTAQKLQEYFSERVVKIVIRRGKKVVGWDEVLQPDLPKSVAIQSWRGQKSLWQAAQQGYDGLLSAGYYLDLMQPARQHYAIDPFHLPPPDTDQPAAAPHQEEAPPVLTVEQKRHLLGGEAAMWMELATPENLDAKLWPRLAAIAERLWSPESVTDPESMYRRLALVNRSLEYLGLAQRTSLESMRQRLSGAFPHPPLDIFSSILEPLKGYDRDSEKYQSETPLNRLVDAIPPESNEAREFGTLVERYLAETPEARRQDSALAATLSDKLARWQKSATAVRPLMQANGLLTPDLPIAAAVEDLCQIGQEAIAHSRNASTVDDAWKARANAILTNAARSMDNMFIMIAGPVGKLVKAL